MAGNVHNCEVCNAGSKGNGEWDLGGPCHCGTEHYMAEEAVHSKNWLGCHHDVKVRFRCSVCRHHVYCTYELLACKLTGGPLKEQNWGHRRSMYPVSSKQIALSYKQVQKVYDDMWDSSCVGVLSACVYGSFKPRDWAQEFFAKLG